MQATGPPLNYRIITYQARYQDAFERLNREWIDALFGVVDEDRRLFADPQGTIIQSGGAILFALAEGQDEPVGTLALIAHGRQQGELAKMAVTQAHQGRGLGRLLLARAVTAAREAGWRELLLESNRRLKPAVNLYRSLGFQEVPLNPNSAFDRCDIRMRLAL